MIYSFKADFLVCNNFPLIPTGIFLLKATFENVQRQKIRKIRKRALGIIIESPLYKGMSFTFRQISIDSNLSESKYDTFIRNFKTFYLSK